MSREICVHLYDAIVALRPEWHDSDPEKGVIKVVMTGSASDKALLKPHIYTKEIKKRLEKRFKDPSDPMKLVIVRDMWLTGFDAPCVHTMYVDKPMKSHNLMQAIARVNRVFKDKPGGLVVDYLGIATELKQALLEYTNSKGKGKPTIRAEEALDIFIEKMSTQRGMMHGFDYTQFRTKALSMLAGAANHILGQEDGKKRFADQVLSASKAFALCCTLDTALTYRDELAFFQAIKSALTKHGTRPLATFHESEVATSDLLDHPAGLDVPGEDSQVYAGPRALGGLTDAAVSKQKAQQVCLLRGIDHPEGSVVERQGRETHESVSHHTNPSFSLRES